MGNPTFLALLKRMAEIHEAKNQDYASQESPYSNFVFAAESAGVETWQSMLNLIGVKVARLVNLLGQGKTPNNESVEDTALDLAVYSVILASWLKDQQIVTTQTTTDDDLFQECSCGRFNCG